MYTQQENSDKFWVQHLVQCSGLKLHTCQKSETQLTATAAKLMSHHHMPEYHVKR